MFSIIYKKKNKKLCDTYKENTPIHRQNKFMHRNIDMCMYTVSTVPE